MPAGFTLTLEGPWDCTGSDTLLVEDVDLTELVLAAAQIMGIPTDDVDELTYTGDVELALVPGTPDTLDITFSNVGADIVWTTIDAILGP